MAKQDSKAAKTTKGKAVAATSKTAKATKAAPPATEKATTPKKRGGTGR